MKWHWLIGPGHREALLLAHPVRLADLTERGRDFLRRVHDALDAMGRGEDPEPLRTEDPQKWRS